MLKIRQSGIYAIICSKTWRSYIGSSVDLIKREEMHFKLLRLNKHTNTELQKAYNKFGKENFYWEIIENVDTKNLLNREKYWIENSINLYNKTKSIYNIIPELKPKDIVKFWSFVEKSEGCWTWKIDKKNKRPRFSYNGIRVSAAKVSYKLNYSDFRDDLIICHKCDNPKCVRPDHLFIGSYSDNARDRDNKGRNSRGKLSIKLANEIREEYLKIQNRKQLKEIIRIKFNINLSQNAINMLLRNETYPNHEYSKN